MKKKNRHQYHFLNSGIALFNGRNRQQVKQATLINYTPELPSTESIHNRMEHRDRGIV